MAAAVAMAVAVAVVAVAVAAAVTAQTAAKMTCVAGHSHTAGGNSSHTAPAAASGPHFTE